MHFRCADEVAIALRRRGARVRRLQNPRNGFPPVSILLSRRRVGGLVSRVAVLACSLPLVVANQKYPRHVEGGLAADVWSVNNSFRQDSRRRRGLGNSAVAGAGSLRVSEKPERMDLR